MSKISQKPPTAPRARTRRPDQLLDVGWTLVGDHPYVGDPNHVDARCAPTLANNTTTLLVVACLGQLKACNYALFSYGSAMLEMFVGGPASKRRRVVLPTFPGPTQAPVSH